VATKLTKDVTRETDIEMGGKPVSVSLSSDEGGQVKFRVKGARTESAVSLREVFGIAANIQRTPVMSEGSDRDATNKGDMVDLGSLEARLMTDGREVMTTEVKGVLFDIIREMHEEARECAGQPSVWNGTKAVRKKSLRRDSDD